MMNPMTVAFLYKQFAQSTFRYYLDNLYITDKMLNDFDISQNILIKKKIGISKFSKTKALNAAINLESIKQIYY